MKYKTTQKDRYGNMRSLEIDTGEKNMEVPPMTSSIPQYEAVGGLAENHPGEPKGSDTVPAWLTPGEFVVNKEAVDMYGPQIKKMNDIGRAVQDGNMNPNQAPPVYANEGIEVPMSKPLRLAFEHQYGSTLEDWKNLLKKREGGFRSDVYSGARDPNVWEPTTGFGHLLPVSEYPFEKYGKGGVQGPFIDEAAANEQFEKDFAIALASAQRNVGTDVWRELQPQQQFALANMAFQMGQSRQAGLSKTMDAIKAGDWKEAQRQAEFNFFANNPNKIHSYTAWANPNTGTPIRVKDFQAFIQAFPEVEEQSSEVPIIIDAVPNVEDPSQVPDGGLIVKDIPRPLGSDQSLGDAVMDKVQGGINVVRDRAGNIINWVGDTATGIHNVLHPTQEELYGQNKNRGGPIYAYDGMQIPLTRGGGKPWWETVNLFPWSGNQVETEYTSRHPGAGGSPAVPSIPNTVDHGFQQALKGKILNQVDSYNPQGLGGEEAVVPNNKWDINDLEIRDDSTSMTNEDWGSSGVNLLAPPEFPEFYRPADAPAPDYGEAPAAWEMRYDNTQPFTSNYDKYVQEEIAGTPAYSIPPVVPPIPVSDWNADPNKLNPPPLVVPDDSNIVGGPGSGPNRITPVIPSIVESYDPQGLGGEEVISIPNIPVSDWNADPNKITPPMPVVPPSGGPPAGAYIGSPSSLGLDPDAYDQETGDLLSYPPSNLEAEAMDYTKPNMLLMDGDILSNMNLPTDSSLDHELARLEKVLDTEMKYLIATRDHTPPSDKQRADLEYYRNNVAKLQEQIKSIKGKKGLKKIEERFSPNVEAAKQEIKDAETIKSLQAVIDNPNASETEKIIAAKEINELGGETTEEKAKKAAEKKLSDLANNVDDNLNNAINNDLNSADGKKATKDAENKDDDDPEKSKARKMFDFLFGDLIDQGEIGRAIAVYLGSRAMGYDHGSSIGYVARQYLTRIDKKNAAFKKWMLDNVGKYTASSIEKFKKTGNPAHLIPIGAKPRSQGRSKMMYHPDLRSEGMAYEFKVKNSQGEDETFWSFDPTGKNDKLRVGVGWTDKNVLDVGTEEINLVKDMLVGMQNKIDKEVTGKKDNKRTKYWSSNSDVPGLIPAAAAGEVAQWLHERDIPPGKYQTAIAEAYTALINSNKRKVKELGDKAVIESSLIPYLQEATVKVRLEDMTFINEEGKTELIPSPAVAMLDGKKRVMNTKLLVDLEKKIDMVFPAGTADRFWAQAAQSWIKDADVRKEFIASAKTKEFKEYTPFALWAEYLLQSEIERAAKETAQ
tara:strand:- start:8686 stop:12525 length:3840 start_codon:yes stop_codon:yes gene_type:complete